MDSQPTHDKRDIVFITVWAAGLLILLGLTWKLWLPGFAEFPRLPVFGAKFSELLLPVHYLASVALVFGLVGAIVNMANVKRWLGLASIALALLFLCNQHCLQPWAWQGCIIATLLAFLPISEAKRWTRWLLISIYFYSALGKFDFQFLSTLGEQFLLTLLSWVGLTSVVNSPLSWWLVMLFPIGEALIAIGLSNRKTRKVAVWFAAALHIVLIAILSPVGMGHKAPVLVWNGLSIALVAWLFLSESGDKPQSNPLSSNPLSSKSPVERLVILFAFIVLLGPLLRPLGLWDHWLSWGLYSPSNSRVEVRLANVAMDGVDESLQQWLVDNNELTCRLQLDTWSLEELGVPIYPQSRFQKAVAVEVLRQHDLTSLAEVIEYSQSHPMTGERSMSRIDLTK